MERKRQCVFFGSTNDDSFLSDPTGARRFNVVHVLKEIDVDAVDRDVLWSAANALERAGYTHFFTRVESEAMGDLRGAHTKSDPWDTKVEAFLAGLYSQGRQVQRFPRLLLGHLPSPAHQGIKHPDRGTCQGHPASLVRRNRPVQPNGRKGKSVRLFSVTEWVATDAAENHGECGRAGSRERRGPLLWLGK